MKSLLRSAGESPLAAKGGRAIPFASLRGIAPTNRFGVPKGAGLLTPRQTEVLREIALGTSMKEIAHRLALSPKTVETHRQNLVKRLGINNVPGLVRYALRTGVVPISWLAK